MTRKEELAERIADHLDVFLTEGAHEIHFDALMSDGNLDEDETLGDVVRQWGEIHRGNL